MSRTNHHGKNYKLTVAVLAAPLSAAALGTLQTASAQAATQINPTYLTTSGTFNNEPWTLEGVNNAGDAGYGTIVGYPGEDRAIMEFPIAGYTAATLGYAVLTPYVYSVTGSTVGNNPVPVEIYTYLGNGTANASYGYNIDSENVVATTAPNSSTGYLNINVTSEVEQALAAGASYIGFMVRATQPNGDVEFNGGYFSGPSSYLSVSTTSLLLSSGNTFTATTDSEIDAPGYPIRFFGGTLATTASFNTSRAITVNSSGGSIDVAPGVTFGLQSTSLTWSGKLNATDSGNLNFALPAGSAVAINPGASLDTAANANVSILGSADPFTDSTTSTSHAAVVNNGTLGIDINSSVATINGTGTLTIGNNATFQLAPGGGGSSVDSLTINPGSSLDLTNNHLFINYGSGPDPIASIAALISSGYSGGSWTGSGITSTTAQTNGGSYGIGFADSADPGNPAGLASGQIEIKYTLLGDANLDGSVNGTDFAILATNFNKADLAGHSGWTEGDFNYDGSINGSDFAELASNFNKGASQSSISPSDSAALDSFALANNLLADVPEPASTTIMVVAGLTVLSRRRCARRQI